LHECHDHGSAVAGSLQGVQHRVARYIEQTAVQRETLALILINAVTHGLETSVTLMAAYGTFIHALDQAILAVFVAEIGLRLFTYRWRFFKDPWSVFDIPVVGIALAPATSQFSVLRALRVLSVLLIIYYVFAVIATNLFAAAFPEWFGNHGR
jgi:voltage-gated sodium channel